MSAKNGWNAAQLASERKLNKPRKMLVQHRGPYSTEGCRDQSCEGCGFLSCNCKMVEFSIEIGEDEPQAEESGGQTVANTDLSYDQAQYLVEEFYTECPERWSNLNFHIKSQWRFRLAPESKPEPQEATGQVSCQAQRPCDRVRAVDYRTSSTVR